MDETVVAGPPGDALGVDILAAFTDRDENLDVAPLDGPVLY